MHNKNKRGFKLNNTLDFIFMITDILKGSASNSYTRIIFLIGYDMKYRYTAI